MRMVRDMQQYAGVLDNIHPGRIAPARCKQGKNPSHPNNISSASERVFLDILDGFLCVFNLANAIGRTNFVRWKFKPKSTCSILQALSCRFFGCNLLVFVFLAFMICVRFV